MATAFATYCAGDGSLNFYKRDSVPSAGDTFDGKVVTKVYTGIEGLSGSVPPWYNELFSTTAVNIVDPIYPTDTSYWFDCAPITSIDLTNLHTGNVTDMSCMFNGCAELTSLDLSGMDVSRVRSMYSMFNGCSALESLNLGGLNASNVTDMSYMFNECSALTSLDLSGIDVSNVTDMSYMFKKCTALKTVEFGFASACKATTMFSMFDGCKELTSVNFADFSVQGIQTLTRMFDGCSKLTSIDLTGFDTRLATIMARMFAGCSQLAKIYVSELWSTESATTSANMFGSCTSLVGGAGTTFDSTKVDATYARIDKPGEPGYFTYKKYIDRNADYLVKAGTMVAIAEAIRSKTGSTDSLTPGQMVEAVNGFSGGPIVGMVDLAVDAREIVIPVDKLYSHLVLFPISVANPNALLSTASVVPLCLTTPEEEFRYNSTFIYSGSDLTPGWYDAEADEFYDDGFQISSFMWGVVNAYPCVVFSETEIKARHLSSSGYKNLAAGKYGYVAW